MKSKLKIFIFIFLIVFSLVFIFYKKEVISTETIETTNETADVSSQTIQSTLTAPGEVQSAKTENISLNTNYSFLMMCVEKEEFVKKGSNLLEYTNGTYITAPYDLVVLDYSVPKTKETCTSNNYISIASTENLYMDINIGEDEISKIIVGQEVEIIANYDETKTYTGTITKINAIGTHSSGGTSFAAIANINNDGFLKIGMSASCNILLEKNENVPCLPIEAIQIENNKKYVLKGNEKIEITTGISDANYVEILSGVSLGDTVQYEKTKITTSSTTENNSKNVFSSLFKRDNNFDRQNKKGF